MVLLLVWYLQILLKCLVIYVDLSIDRHAQSNIRFLLFQTECASDNFRSKYNVFLTSFKISRASVARKQIYKVNLS